MASKGEPKDGNLRDRELIEKLGRHSPTSSSDREGPSDVLTVIGHPASDPFPKNDGMVALDEELAALIADLSFGGRLDDFKVTEAEGADGPQDKTGRVGQSRDKTCDS